MVKAEAFGPYSMDAVRGPLDRNTSFGRNTRPNYIPYTTESCFESSGKIARDQIIGLLPTTVTSRYLDYVTALRQQSPALYHLWGSCIILYRLALVPWATLRGSRNLPVREPPCGESRGHLGMAVRQEVYDTTLEPPVLSTSPLHTNSGRGK